MPGRFRSSRPQRVFRFQILPGCIALLLLKPRESQDPRQTQVAFDLSIWINLSARVDPSAFDRTQLLCARALELVGKLRGRVANPNEELLPKSLSAKSLTPRGPGKILCRRSPQSLS